MSKQFCFMVVIANILNAQDYCLASVYLVLISNCLYAYIVSCIQTNIYAVVLLFNNTFMLLLCEVSLRVIRHSLE